MTDKTVRPEAPVDPRDNVGALGTSTPSVEPDSSEGQPSTSMTLNDALESLETLRAANHRLIAENAVLRMELDDLAAAGLIVREELDEARGVHKPVPFPCTVYRGTAETTANGAEELKSLLSQGWSETK